MQRLLLLAALLTGCASVPVIDPALHGKAMAGDRAAQIAAGQRLADEHTARYGKSRPIATLQPEVSP